MTACPWSKLKLPCPSPSDILGETCVGWGNRCASLQDVDIGRVGGSEMVIVQSIFELQLPIRIESVADFPGHDLKLSGRALVDDEIEKRLCIAEKITELGDIGRKACKYEPAIAVEPRHVNQIMVGIVECRGILTGRAFRNG